MEGHFSYYRNYMAYQNKLNCRLSQDMSQLRDSTVNSSRLLLLSRYVSQLKNKNSAFPFTQNPYEFIVNPNNYSNNIGLLQFVQNSSFFISYLKENPQLLATITFTTRKQWQFSYLINCILPSLFGYFACQEYSESAIDFYSKIIERSPSPKFSMQVVQPFFHSCITYHFFEAAYHPFIHSILVDENILKNTDKLVSVYADLFIEYVTNSIKFLPNVFFKLLDLFKNWNFDQKRNLIVDNFLFPELKIWSVRLNINPELKNFVFRIIDMLSISLSQRDSFNFNDYKDLESSFFSLSSSFNYEPMIYMTDSNSTSNLSSLNLGIDLLVQPTMTMSRSTSTFKPSKNKSQKLSKESRTSMILMKNLINYFFSDPNINGSLYEMTVLYDNYSDDIFAQCTQFTLSAYDVQFLAKALERIHKFPTKLASSIFMNETILPFLGGVFYCHVYSHHIKKKNIKPSYELFNNNYHIDISEEARKMKFNVSLLENDLFIKFLKFNNHYGKLFESFMIEIEKTSKSEQNENIEQVINYSALMNEIRSQNDRILYHASFLLDSYTNQILENFTDQPNKYKKKSFIKVFTKLSSVFDSINFVHAKKILYLKLLDLFYKDLIGHYWHVLEDFGRFWSELVNNPKEKLNMYKLSNTNANFLPFFVDSITLLSQLDGQSLHSKYYIMSYAFNLLSYIAKRTKDENEVYEMAFQHVKSIELISSFLVIDSLAMKVDVFQNLCTKNEINCWNHMKENIGIFLKRNEQYHQVYLSITEYLIAISPSLLYNSCE